MMHNSISHEFMNHRKIYSNKENLLESQVKKWNIQQVVLVWGSAIFIISRSPRPIKFQNPKLAMSKSISFNLLLIVLGHKQLKFKWILNQMYTTFVDTIRNVLCHFEWFFLPRSLQFYQLLLDSELRQSSLVNRPDHRGMGSQVVCEQLIHNELVVWIELLTHVGKNNFPMASLKVVKSLFMNLIFSVRHANIKFLFQQSQKVISPFFQSLTIRKDTH